MKSYADPEHCPDCGAGLDALDRHVRCPACRLPLDGRSAADLYATLLRADTILAFLRSERDTAELAVVGVGVVSPQRTGAGADRPHAPFGTPSAPPSRLTVPALLLGLGALCVLVAAVVFLAIAWNVLGVAGRTGVLVGLTAGAGALTTLFTSRSLRAAAETLGVLALALFAFDLAGARASGWFGPVEAVRFVSLAAGTVAVAGVLATLALRRVGPALTGLQVVATVAYAVSAVAGVGDAAPDHAELGLAGWLLVSLAVVPLVRRLRLTVLVAGPAVVALVAAGGLVLAGVGQTLADNERHTTSWGAMWPLLLVAGLLAGLVALTRQATATRAVGYAASSLLVLFAAVVPHLHSLTAATVVAGVLLVACGTAALARVDVVTRTAWLVAGAGAAVAAVGIGTYLAGLAVRLLETAESTDLWELGAGTTLPHAPAYVAGWTLVIVVAAAGVAHLLFALAAPGRTDPVSLAAGLWAPLVGVAAAVSVCGYSPSLAVACLLLLAASIGLAAGALRGPVDARRFTAGGAAGLFAATAVLSLAAATVTVVVWLVGVAAGLALLRSRHPDLRAAAAAWVVMATVVITAAIGHLAGTAPRLITLVVLVVLAALVVSLPRLAAGGPAGARRPVQGAALLVAGLAVAVGFSHTLPHLQLLWLAVHLTLAGAIAAAIGIVDRDRVAVLVGTVVLLAATWVRLVDTGVHTVEAYTGPVALLLGAVGLHTLLTRPGSRTRTALGPALGVALLPSLLLVLGDPLTGRAVLLGLGCLILVAAGVALRWSAPLLYGAAVGAVVVVVELAPLGNGMPRWVLIGSAGALLLVAGATWEHLVVQGRRVWSQVSALR